ncbi:hypothetical protein L1049_024139 [Liquidambar formosana]|uniref:Leucine-rich repeat-containing N-terminal plant-type domain-containing protein n=1 Tax=Liquidambar formosana TaxID=63359 RepID=A0AAP0S095_LIQFO
MKHNASSPLLTLSLLTMQATKNHPDLLTLLLSLTVSFLSLSSAAAAGTPSPPLNLLVPSDAVSLLSFKAKADLDNKLLYALHERFDYCQWQGVKCAQGRVVRFALPGFALRGVFPTDTLTRLDQLRVLSLQNNSLAGPIPDLSGLANLKSLFLDQNSFTGTFPLSVLSLHRLRTLDLSYNNLTGPIPVELNVLDRIIDLRLQRNQFNGTVPPLNQSTLKVFNVSGNNLTGAIPITPTLSRFDISSFSWNPNLCGEIIHRDCYSPSPFFDSPIPSQSPWPVSQNSRSQGVALSPSPKKHYKTGLILGFSVGIIVLIGSILCFFAVVRKQRNQTNSKPAMASSDVSANAGRYSPCTHNASKRRRIRAKCEENM